MVIKLNDKSSYQGLKTDAITPQFGLQQLINEPIHLTGNSCPCVDLTFTSQSHLVIESCVHFSLHPNGHHQLVFANFDVKIFYAQPCEHEICHYDKANTDLICRLIHEFSWEKRFSNTDANQNVYLFNKIIKNILPNFILHETIVYDDCDPPWINSKVKYLIAEKNIAKKCYIQNNTDIQLF